MPQRHAVARLSELKPGDSTAVTCENERIALFNVDGVVYAISNLCPHAAGPLVEGFVEDCRIICPWHGWSFPLSLEDPPNDGVLRYNVTVEGDDVYVELPGEGR